MSEMRSVASAVGQRRLIAKCELDRLIDNLRQAGYSVMGPKVEQAAIVYAEIASTA